MTRVNLHEWNGHGKSWKSLTDDFSQKKDFNCINNYRRKKSNQCVDSVMQLRQSISKVDFDLSIEIVDHEIIERVFAFIPETKKFLVNSWLGVAILF